MVPNKLPTALITGASSGLGCEIALRYQGDMVITGRNIEALTEISSRRHAADVSTYSVSGDLEDAEIRGCIVEMSRRYNVSRVILSAGIYDDNVFGVNTLTINAIKNIELIAAILRYLPQDSVIMHINSTAGKTVAPTEEASYSASKHAMAAFLRSIRPDLRKRRIRVIDAFLGAIRTPMTTGRPDWQELIDPAEAAEILISCLPAKNTCQIHEIHIGRWP